MDSGIMRNERGVRLSFKDILAKRIAIALDLNKKKEGAKNAVKGSNN